MLPCFYGSTCAENYLQGCAAKGSVVAPTPRTQQNKTTWGPVMEKNNVSVITLSEFGVLFKLE